MPVLQAWSGVLLLAMLVVGTPATAAEPLQVRIGYLSTFDPDRQPLSLVDLVLADEGQLGARLGVADNATTGQFLGHDYELIELPAVDDPLGALSRLLAQDVRMVVADLEAADLQALAPMAEEAGAILFNVRAREDALRIESCMPSVFHVTPSHAMRADALAQFLVWKRWNRWLLIKGSHPQDDLWAAALIRAANRFGADIVDEREFEDMGGARRSDSGHVQVQSQIPVFTQNAADHDVVVTADMSEVFAEYLPYNTWQARPVVGSSGLVPVNWSRPHEQWGGTQLQRRFEKEFARNMTERDYNAWLAARIVGEAVSRTGSADTQTVRDYLLGDDFEIAAFKGEALTFRTWNQQLRQPVLLSTARMLVSVSPQEGFLHRVSKLDTLGYDRSQSACVLNP